MVRLHPGEPVVTRPRLGPSEVGPASGGRCAHTRIDRMPTVDLVKNLKASSRQCDLCHIAVGLVWRRSAHGTRVSLRVTWATATRARRNPGFSDVPPRRVSILTIVATRCKPLATVG